MRAPLQLPPDPARRRCSAAYQTLASADPQALTHLGDLAILFPMSRVARLRVGLSRTQLSTRAPLLVTLGACLLSTAGCAQSHGPGHHDARVTMTTTPSPLPTRHPAEANLVVVYWPHGQGSPETKTWSLRCDPPGGDHPRRTASCQEIERAPLSLGRATHACRTKALPGSPQTMVTGTFGGRPVDRSYRPGCDDWTTLHALLTGHL